MRYFQIMTGLRGCYMPDDSHVIACNTRRELKRALAKTLDYADAVGAGKRDVAALAAKAWRDYPAHKSVYALAFLPFRYKHNEPGSRPFSIEVCKATRAEYLSCEDPA